MQRKLESVKNARNQPDTTGGAVAHKSSMRRLNSLKSMKKYTGKNRRASLVSEVMISPSKTGDSDMSSDDSGLEDDDEELVTEDDKVLDGLAGVLSSGS